MTKKPTNEQLRSAFQNVANAIGSEIIQCCIEAGEEPVLPRDACFDYMELHGGEHGKAVAKWLLSKVTLAEINRVCDAAGVPADWA